MMSSASCCLIALFPKRQLYSNSSAPSSAFLPFQDYFILLADRQAGVRVRTYVLETRSVAKPDGSNFAAQIL